MITTFGEGKHRTELGVNSGIFTRFDNVLSNFDKKICETKNLIEEQNQQLELTKKELDNPFSREDELQEKSKRLAAVIAELENAQRNEDTNKIENPYLIEVQSQEQIEKLKESGINFELPETKDGKLIVRVESNDASKVKEIIRKAFCSCLQNALNNSHKLVSVSF